MFLIPLNKIENLNMTSYLEWSSYLNSIDLILILITFYLCLFYIYNLNSNINKKHIVLTSVGLIPFIILFVLVYSTLIEIPGTTYGEQFNYFKQVLIMDDYSLFCKRILFYFVFILVLSFRRYLFKVKESTSVEFSLILVFLCLFCSLVFSSYDLFFSFICLEGVGLCTYILSAYPFDKISIETASKYLWFSVCSAATMISGIFFLFIVSRDLHFTNISLVLIESFSNQSQGSYILLKIGLVLILLGFFIKLALFPAHIWSLDVYEGSWSPVTSILMVCIKATYTFFFFRFMLCVSFPVFSLWYKLFLVLTIISLVYGAVGAIKQTTIKRTLAYTSISQTGFFFLGLISCSIEGFSASFFHVTIYIISLLLFFILFFLFYNYNNKELIFITDFSLMGKNNPLFGIAFTLVFLSISGIPPFLGFYTKYFLFSSLINSGFYLLLFFSIFSSVITSFVYIRFIKLIWFEREEFFVNDIINSNKIEKNNWNIIDYFLSINALTLIFLLVFYMFNSNLYLELLISLMDSLLTI